ncbi:hypothetical protein KCTC52924_03517 [Arenibacter antarcticus]|uniref:Competence protein CoiA-like family protein n=1 Tax=Arenibacter antarcticus TaxID=2040469 RepID=A0ABW5VEF5_9FLAO|nr:hypothetical protein [Arenibacter sp. H213]MCM4166577.1 hypothetical protein [Arenibacter sp. H213]
MRNKTNDNDYQNDWAFNDDFTKEIHISEAKSGLNGYYCLGCKKEMQAAKGLKRVHYYRHHAKNVDKGNTECVVASRNYRERLARDILQRLKELKVPEVLKFPAIGEEGVPMLLKLPETIRAYKVKSELTFYEDENCQINFGKNPDIDERFLLIRPDITFFNEKDEPVLLIEFVLYHKIDIEKKLKLKRLGLNTVQIIIPKKPGNEIENALKSRTKVKWVYNEIEANTKYIFVSEATDNGVWSIDDDQRNIFEENYKCRANQIKYLIRTVKRALESQSYKRAEQHFESEISRVERATEAERKGLEEMEARIDEEVREQFRDRAFDVESQRGNLSIRERGFREKFNDLDDRYQSKKEELRREQKGVDRDKESELENGGTEESIRERFKRSSEELRDEFEEISEGDKRIIHNRMESNGKISEKTEQLTELFGQFESEEQGSFTNRKNDIGKSFKDQSRLEEESLSENNRREERSIKELQFKERTLSEEFRKLEEREQESYREGRAEIDREEKGFEESIREELIRELGQTANKLPKRLKFVLEAQRVGRDYEIAHREEQYYRRAREIFNKGTWKTQ